MKLESEILDLYDKLHSAGRYEGVFNVPSSDFVEEVLAKIGELRRKCSSRRGLYWEQILELLEYAEFILYYFRAMPGSLLATTLESYLVSKVFLERKKLDLNALVRAERMLDFIKRLLDRGDDVCIENLEAELNIILDLLEAMKDSALRKLREKILYLKRECEEAKSRISFRLDYDYLVGELYGIDVRELEAYLDREIYVTKKLLEKISTQKVGKLTLSVEEIVGDLRKKARELIGLPSDEKLYFRRMPEKLEKYYGLAVYLPSGRTARGSVSGVLMISNKLASLDSGDIILTLAHETYFGHHLHYASVANLKTSAIFKISTYGRATPLVEGVGVYGETVAGHVYGFTSTLLSRMYLKFLRARSDIARHKYGLDDRNIEEKFFPEWRNYKIFSKIYPGYWLCHVAGFKKITSKNFKSLREFYRSILSLGLVSFRILEEAWAG